MAGSARSRAAAARDLLAIAQFLDINPGHWAEQLIRLRAEKQLLESTSKELHLLRQRKSQLESDIDTLDQQVRQLDGEVRLLENELSVSESASKTRQAQLNESVAYDHARTDADFIRLLGPHAPITMDNPDQLTHSAAQSIQGRINNELGRVNEAADKMVAAMSNFLKEFLEFGQTLLAGRAQDRRRGSSEASRAL